MSISAVEIEVPLAQKITITDDTLSIDLSDGRSISVPLAWFPRLQHASPAERKHWRFIGKGPVSTGMTSTKTSASRDCLPGSRQAKANCRSHVG